MRIGSVSALGLSPPRHLYVFRSQLLKTGGNEQRGGGGVCEPRELHGSLARERARARASGAKAGKEKTHLHGPMFRAAKGRCGEHGVAYCACECFVCV